MKGHLVISPRTTFTESPCQGAACFIADFIIPLFNFWLFFLTAHFFLTLLYIFSGFSSEKCYVRQNRCGIDTGIEVLRVTKYLLYWSMYVDKNILHVALSG